MPRVRVIGDDGEMIGVLSRDEALRMAEEAGLDLVEIQPNSDPPVCRIMDFGKFRFEQQKKAGVLIDQGAGHTICDPRFFD